MERLFLSKALPLVGGEMRSNQRQRYHVPMLATRQKVEPSSSPVHNDDVG
jgi:hypothetical protein